jgi:hypothetical protein
MSDWVDNSSRVFGHRAVRHGRAPWPYNWEFGYQIPAGFHYDVRGLRGQAVWLTDCFGKMCRGSAGGHINVDPHGRVR